MFTQCSKCETVFRLSAEALRAAGGQVRCGRCGEVFNALSRLAEDVASFTKGESPLFLESRAEEILESSVPVDPVDVALAESPDADFSAAGIGSEVPPGVEIAELTFLEPIDEDLAAETSLEFTLPPGELDRVFVETRPSPLQQLSADGRRGDKREPTARHPESATGPAEPPPAHPESPTPRAGRLPAHPESPTPRAGALPARPESTPNDATPAVHPESLIVSAEPGTAYPGLPVAQAGPSAAHPGSAASEGPPAIHPESATSLTGPPLAHSESTTPARLLAVPASAAAAKPALRVVKVVRPSTRIAGLEIAQDVRRDMLSNSAYAESPQIGAPPARWSFVAWLTAAIALCLLLVVQVVRGNEGWLAHVPLLGGSSSPLSSLSVYQLRQWGVTGDPDAKGTLRVRASILNTAAQLQAYPLLRVTLLNRFGTHVGAREFEPAEYLGHGTARLLAPGERADATLDILDPGKDAEGFEIDVCVRGADKHVVCASDAAAPTK